MSVSQMTLSLRGVRRVLDSGAMYLKICRICGSASVLWTPTVHTARMPVWKPVCARRMRPATLCAVREYLTCSGSHYFGQGVAGAFFHCMYCYDMTKRIQIHKLRKGKWDGNCAGQRGGKCYNEYAFTKNTYSCKRENYWVKKMIAF